MEPNKDRTFNTTAEQVPNEKQARLFNLLKEMEDNAHQAELTRIEVERMVASLRTYEIIK